MIITGEDIANAAILFVVFPFIVISAIWCAQKVVNFFKKN